VLAKIPREMSKTKDITGGLPRVVELFEARKPKDPAVVSEIDGRIRITEPVRGQRRIVVEGEGEEHREYSIPRYAHVSVQEGEFIQAGDPITEGAVNPHDILSILGEKEMQRHLVDKIQEVYRSQGVAINDKHIEVIVRQMMRFVKVVDPGDTDFLLEQQIPRYIFERENERVIEAGGEPATATSLLLGITKASLATESFISAASFQETTRVLTEAAVSGKVDNLHGLKENVIVGRLIPAGTGAARYRRTLIDPVPDDEFEPVDEPDNLYREMTEAATALIEARGEGTLADK
jgi:DNA-directed RNA polymerase subunit beta'